MIAEYSIEGEDNFIDRLTAIEQCVAHVETDGEIVGDKKCETSHSHLDDYDDQEIERGDDEDDNNVGEYNDEKLRRKLDDESDEKLDKEMNEKKDKIGDSVIEEGDVDDKEEDEEEEDEEDEEEEVYHHLPHYISQCYPTLPQAIGDFVLDHNVIDGKSLEFLTLPHTALSAYWAAKRLSIVGRHDRRSYCFTHSYGRLYDKSSGSVFWEVSFPIFVTVSRP